MRILLADPLEECGIRILEEKCEVIKEYGVGRERLLEIIEGFDGMLVRANTRVDRAVIDKAVRLKVIGMPGAGLDHIDVEYAQSKGIKVVNVPGGNVDSVAELTVGLMITLLRNMWIAGYKTRTEHCWNKYLFMGRELSGKKLGIVGFGRIGRRVAEIAQVFKMSVVAYDPYIPPTGMPEAIPLVSFEELLMEADIITLHLPLTAETYHLISTEQINIMKPGAYIINVSRGGIIDEEAVYQALKSGKLGGVAVDVMENEPPPDKPIPYSKLFELDNFVVTPHLGAWTVEAQNRVAEIVAREMLRALEESRGS